MYLIKMKIVFLNKEKTTMTGQEYNVYTFNDKDSHNNFSVYSIPVIQEFENLKEYQQIDANFEFYIDKKGQKKIRYYKGDK